MPTKYPQSFKDRATRMVFDRLEDEDAPSRYVVIRETAPKLSIATQTLRRWVEQAEVDTGQKSGVSTDAQAQIRKLKRENAELRWANEILKTASLDSNRQCNTPSQLLVEVEYGETRTTWTAGDRTPPSLGTMETR
ncbi:hypothetical protein DCC26_07385, partial [Auritidibacter sp. NML120779]